MLDNKDKNKKMFCKSIFDEAPNDARKVFNNMVNPKVVDKIEQMKNDLWTSMAKNMEENSQEPKEPEISKFYK